MFRSTLRVVATLALVLTVLFPATGHAAPPLPGALPLDKAIRIGTGSKVVIEFSDPDCPFSRRMVRYWDLRNDVTRYVFLVTLSNHPDAPQKARYILAAKNKPAAYRSVLQGGLDFEDLDQRRFDDHGLLALHRAVAARLGVIGTPTYFINGVEVNGAKVKKIETLLGGAKIPFDVKDPD